MDYLTRASPISNPFEQYCLDRAHAIQEPFLLGNRRRTYVFEFPYAGRALFRTGYTQQFPSTTATAVQIRIIRFVV